MAAQSPKPAAAKPKPAAARPAPRTPSKPAAKPAAPAVPAAPPAPPPAAQPEPAQEWRPPTKKTTPPLLDPVAVFRITAWVLGLVALVGIVSATLPQANVGEQFLAPVGIQFTWIHNVLHILLAAAAALFGYAALQPRLVKTMASVLGGVYLLLGILGFFVLSWPGDAGILALTPTLNAVHLLLGAWLLAAGLLSDA